MKKGFSLIEILVVLGIMALLIMFLVPNLLGVQDRSKETAVKAVMHNVQIALEAYNMENMTYPVATNISLKNLCDNYLIPGGYLGAVPKNAFTGQGYQDKETSGKVEYNFDSKTGIYTMTGYGRGGTRQILQLGNL